MGTLWEVLLPIDAPTAWTNAAVESLERVAEVEQALSIYLAESEWSRLNRAPVGQPMRVTTTTWDVIQLAHRVWQITEGGFDITAGPMVEAWGFTRRSGRRPTAEQIEALREHVGMERLIIDNLRRTIHRSTDPMQLNPGGIGKGYALQEVSRRLKLAGVRDFIAHGGQSSIVAFGNQSAPRRGWSVALRDPFHRHQLLGTLWLKDQSLATSGAGQQFFHLDGKRYGHILDPRTGRPAETDLKSITIVTRDAAYADALATGLYVQGLDQAIKQARHPLHEPFGMIAIIGEEIGSKEVIVDNLPEDCHFESIDDSTDSDATVDGGHFDGPAQQPT
jgi:FAD:protein FMN transferase